MEDKTTAVEVLLGRAQAYTKTSIQLFKLKATDKLSEMVSNLATGFVILAILALFFVNLNIGIAILLGDLLGKVWLGFMVVAGFYACAGIIVYLFRDKWIKRPISDSIIAQLLKEEPLDDQHLSD